ncbi:periplasmic heavy metal sensor [Phaeovulum sp.]|uniref:periplasmic heavy metal sensor n=1 Tax=Phaeovulum sp. TaxID=2934796 RepID=UPI00272FA532|nr:periplasmic heavy metal sensor [Phaeovulum sp.]MDP1667428.1 periplasmic heavy metal sensor [Phaeovulum sp.]MDZ4119945.1 periplasmic heavy metal sensor [Phaeovulum sp.]
MTDTLPPTTPPAATPPAPASGGASRSARALLIGSLAVNLLLLGILAGGAISIARHAPQPVISDITLGTFTAALSPEDREALRLAAEAESLGIREMHRAAGEDYRALIAAVRAEPWNEAAARVAIAAYGLRAQERLVAGERLMLQRLAAMGPAGRRAFAERLEETLRRGFRAERAAPPPRGN